MIGTISVLVILCLIWLYYKWAFLYWKKKGVPCVKPTIPFGNAFLVLTLKRYLGIILKDVYLDCKNLGYRHNGEYLFSWPRYMPIDIKIIKYILMEDFKSFSGRGFYYNEKDDPLSANLFSVGGERWKTLRSKLSPVFTTGKLKVMLDSLLICGSRLNSAIKEIEIDNGIIDAKILARNFSINVIALCAFGVDCDCFKNPSSEFIRLGLSTFDFSTLLRRVKACIAFSMPNLASFLRIKFFGKDYTRFFTSLVEETIEFREKHKVTRKDLIQLLVELKNNVRNDISNEESSEWQKGATIEELAAQVFIFFSAGFETTYTTLYFCLYELALNSDVQKKVRQEINKVLNIYKGDITYETLSDMKYTYQVLEETLRKYPPVAYISRKCEQACRIPGTNFILDKDICIDISVLGIHYDPDFYPEPEKFDPNRFSEESKSYRPSCAYLPFGEGPRTCIGMRFAIMELKVALTVILQQYELSLNMKTKTPLEIKPDSFTLASKHDIFLNIIKIA